MKYKKKPGSSDLSSGNRLCFYPKMCRTWQKLETWNSHRLLSKKVNTNTEDIGIRIFAAVLTTCQRTKNLKIRLVQFCFSLVEGS